MDRDQLIAFLRSTDLLAQVPDAALGTAADQMRVMHLQAGQVLFHEGEPGDAAYVILDGELSLMADSVELVRRRRGDVVGEFSLIDEQPRSAGAVARSALTMLRWDRAAFLHTLALDPEVARGIFRVLTRKLRDDISRGVGLLQERTLWRHDLELAREIQASMLPAPYLRGNGLEVAGHCAPADAVGGDFYDVLPGDGQSTALIVADVTGHSFYSGLYVAMAKSCLHTQARFDPAPASMMDAMRRSLALSRDWPVLMSCAYLLFQPDRALLTYANAGHPHPLHWRRDSGTVTPLDVLDPILGAQDVGEAPYSVREVPWQPGDVLLLYSDGLTEAHSGSRDMFGRERVERALAEARGADAMAVRDMLISEVTRHVGQQAPMDDLTLVVARSLESTDG